MFPTTSPIENVYDALDELRNAIGSGLDDTSTEKRHLRDALLRVTPDEEHVDRILAVLDDEERHEHGWNTLAGVAREHARAARNESVVAVDRLIRRL